MRYKPNAIKTKIKDGLNMSYYELCDYVDKANITLKEKDIKRFLEEKYLEKHPDAIEKRKKLYQQKVNDEFSNTESFVERFSLELEYSKYKYEPYTLEYFKNYTRILKNKCNNLIKIIDGLINETISKKVLDELDIDINDKGYMLDKDILRISKPFIYNFNKLKEMVDKGNNLNTYLEFKISLDSVYRNDCSENELYPSEKLQDEHAEMFSKTKEGYIPLTEKQKTLSRKKEHEYLMAVCDVIKDM